MGYQSILNRDGTVPGLSVVHSPDTAHGLPALAVDQSDSTGTAIHAQGAGTLLNLRDASGVSQFKVSNSGVVNAASGIVGSEVFQLLTATNTLTNDTSAHPIFNATTAGALSVLASTTYEFEMLIIASGFSASSHTLSLTFGGTATYTAASYLADTAVAAGGAVSRFASAAATVTAITAATTSTLLNAVIKGTLSINAAGTVIPQITQGTASAAASILAGTRFRAWAVGSDTVTNVGNWT